MSRGMRTIFLWRISDERGQAGRRHGRRLVHGAARNNWGYRKIASLDAFIARFLLLKPDSEIANLSGAIRARCDQVGRALSWADSWAAATALWLRVPLVVHDRDLERIPGLRVLTVHKDWQVREESEVLRHSVSLWLGEKSTRGCEDTDYSNSPPHFSAPTPRALRFASLRSSRSKMEGINKLASTSEMNRMAIPGNNSFTTPPES